MLRRLTCLLTPLRGFKDDLTVKWVRPAYVPAYNPKKSGDLEPAPRITSDTIALEFQDAEELKDAPESVRKMFSVGHLGGHEASMLVRRDLMQRVQRHKYDEMTAESRIARLTATIRSLQLHMEKFPKENKGKKAVQELIDKRKKLLKYLRQYDYRRFEWILERLNIEYKAHPESFHKLSRKESLRKLTEMYSDDIKSRKLADYRDVLESQQGLFLERKLEDFRTIRREQLALQLPVTVFEQDIRKVEEALEKWTIKNEIKESAVKIKNKKKK